MMKTKFMTQEKLCEMLENLETDFSGVIFDGLSFDKCSDRIHEMTSGEYIRTKKYDETKEPERLKAIDAGNDSYVHDGYIYQPFDFQRFNFRGCTFRNMRLDLFLLDLSDFHGASIENCTLKEYGLSGCTFDHATLRNVCVTLSDFNPYDKGKYQEQYGAETVKELLNMWTHTEGDEFNYPDAAGSSFVNATIIDSSFDKGVGSHDFTGADIINTRFINCYYRAMIFNNAYLSNVKFKNCNFYTVYGGMGEKPSINLVGAILDQVEVQNVTLEDQCGLSASVNSAAMLVKAANQEKEYAINHG